MKGGSPRPDTGVLRVLTSQQRATGWRGQLEVEKSLGLEKGAISSYFEKLGRARKSKNTFFATRRQLRVEGVYRVQDLPLGKTGLQYSSNNYVLKHNIWYCTVYNKLFTSVAGKRLFIVR